MAIINDSYFRWPAHPLAPRHGRLPSRPAIEGEGRTGKFTEVEPRVGSYMPGQTNPELRSTCGGMVSSDPCFPTGQVPPRDDRGPLRC